MKKILLTIAIALSITAIANAQTGNNEVGKTKSLGYTKTSIFLQYGYAPVSSFDFWAKGIFNKNYPGIPSSVFEPEVESMSSFGSISAGAAFNFTDLIEFWVPFSYSHSNGKFVADKKYIEEGGKGQNFEDNWYSLTPNVKFNWYRSKSENFKLYSRVGLGIALATRKIVSDHGVDLDSKCAFTFIASPIGMEVGRNVTFFAEAGFGQTGVINAGVRFKFKKTSRGFNSDGTAKQYNWTDRYQDKK